MTKRKPTESATPVQPPVPCAFSVKTWCDKYVELGERTLWEDVKQGRIAVVQRGTRRLITASAMEQYLERLTVPAYGVDAVAEARSILNNRNV